MLSLLGLCASDGDLYSLELTRTAGRVKREGGNEWIGKLIGKAYKIVTFFPSICILDTGVYVKINKINKSHKVIQELLFKI